MFMAFCRAQRDVCIATLQTLRTVRRLVTVMPGGLRRRSFFKENPPCDVILASEPPPLYTCFGLAVNCFDGSPMVVSACRHQNS